MEAGRPRRETPVALACEPERHVTRHALNSNLSWLRHLSHLDVSPLKLRPHSFKWKLCSTTELELSVAILKAATNFLLYRLYFVPLNPFPQWQAR